MLAPMQDQSDESGFSLAVSVRCTCGVAMTSLFILQLTHDWVLCHSDSPPLSLFLSLTSSLSDKPVKWYFYRKMLLWLIVFNYVFQYSLLFLAFKNNMIIIVVKTNKMDRGLFNVMFITNFNCYFFYISTVCVLNGSLKRINICDRHVSG